MVDSLRLGVYGVHNEPAIVSLDRSVHGIICGPTGSGKSFLLNSIAEQAKTGGADVIVCDPKGGHDFEDPTASGPIEVTAALEEVAAAVVRRNSGTWYHRMIVIADELTALGLRQSGEPKTAARDRLDRTQAALGTSVLLGRSSGVHLILGTQRGDLNGGVLTGAIRDQLGWRVGLGYLSGDGYRMLGWPSDLEPPRRARGNGWASGLSGVEAARPVSLRVTRT